MRLPRLAVLATLLFAAAAHAGTGTVTRYVDVSNRAHDSVTSLEVAPTGSDAFREKPLGAPLGGGGESATIEITGEHCLYDIRLKFRNGRTRVYKDVDICEGDKLVIRPLPRETGRLARSEKAPARYADGHIDRTAKSMSSRTE